MKLNRNFIQISTTAMVTSAVFVTYLSISQPNVTQTAKARSEAISWDEAQRLMLAFKDFRPLRVKYPDPANADQEIKEDLQGFVFDANHIREILNDNHSKETPDEIVFYLGQSGVFPDGFLHRSGIINMIAVGSKDGQLLITDKTATSAGPSIYDKADPCPPNCSR